MSPKRKNTASGVVTFHAPFPASLLKSEECVVDAASCRKSMSPPTSRTRSAGKCAKAGRNRGEASPSGPQPDTRQDRLSRTSLRRLQAKMEAENQQAKEIIRPFLDTENGIVKLFCRIVSSWKELERFLSQREVTELRRRELLHKFWTERVWFPLQRRVEEHTSSRSPAEAKRRQSLYNHYLLHCNTKHQKAKLLQGFKLPQSDRPFSESLMSQADTLLQASSNYPGSASRTAKTPADDETGGRKSS
ncbi:hypothetical protein L3Q82_011173, partial [Scortum barcoo]